MKDNELRGIFLQKLYESRKETQDMRSLLTPSDFPFPITLVEIIRIGLQLQEHGLAEMAADAGNVWRLTARGVDVVERGGIGSPIQIRITNIANSVGVVVGDHNTQDVRASFSKILNAIEEAPVSAEQKTEAKNLLGEFLKHPVIASIAGGVAQVLAKSVLSDHK